MLETHLNSNEREQGGFTHKFLVTFADLASQTTANTAQAITLKALPPGTLVKNVALSMPVAFQDLSDTGFNSTAATVGDSGTANLFVTSTELNVNGTEVYNKAGTGTQKAYDTANSLILTVNSMIGKSLSNIDAGKLYVLAEIVYLGQLGN